MRRLLAAALFLTLLLLPTHLPRWMDSLGVRPAAAEPALRTFRGTVAKRTTLARSLAGTLSPAAIHDLVEAARPVYDLARALASASPFGVLHGQRGPAARLHLRDRRAAHPARDPPRRRPAGRGRVPRATTREVATVAGIDHVEPLRRGRGRGRGGPARPRPGRHLRLGRGLQHRDPEGRLVPGGGREAVPSTAASAATAASSPPSSCAAIACPACRALRGRARAPATTRPTARRCARPSCARPSSSRGSRSRFTAARFHPILNVTRPHYGVDYAAPMGTPVHGRRPTAS